MKPGDKVVMSEECKRALLGKCGMKGPHKGPFNGGNDCYGCSRDHVLEFVDCTGIVIGKMDYNNVPKGHKDYDPSKVGPEWDVHWQPSDLRYSYATEHLKVVR